MANLDRENPVFAARMQALISAAEAATGAKAQITSGYRSPEEQAQIYANTYYRDPAHPFVYNGKAYPVTGPSSRIAAKPGGSEHQHGTAMDIGPGPVRDWMAKNAPKFGVEWGGNWGGSQYDPPHFQLTRSDMALAEAGKLPLPPSASVPDAPVPLNRPEWASAFAPDAQSSNAALAAIQSEAPAQAPSPNANLSANAGDALAFDPARGNDQTPAMDARFDPASGFVRPTDTANVRANMLPPPISTNAPGQVGQSPLSGTGAGIGLPAGGAAGGGSVAIPSTSSNPMDALYNFLQAPFNARVAAGQPDLMQVLQAPYDAAHPTQGLPPAINPMTEAQKLAMIATPPASSPPMIANIGPVASPSTFPARPGMVGSNGSAPYDFNYGAPANPVTVPPYTPGQSVADINLNDALYPNGQPTYASQGALPDIPKWAMPSVPVTVIPPGRGNTVVNGAVNSAIRNAAPDIAAALGPVFGGARSLVDNLPSMSGPTTGDASSTVYHAPPVSQTPITAMNLWSDPSYMARAPSPGSGNGGSHIMPPPSLASLTSQLGATLPNYGNSSSTNYGAPGYSGNSSYSPSSYGSSVVSFPGGDVYGNVGSSSYAMNDPSGSGNTYSQPKTITQQVLNPAWNQWQAQHSSGDTVFSGTDTGLSWAGLNTGDPNDPFSSFASPANRPAMAAPPKYLTINKPNPNYVTPPLANPTGGNWFADRFNGSHVGRLLTLFGGGQNASDMLFGNGSTGLAPPPIPRVPSLFQTGLTAAQRNVSTPAYAAAVDAGQGGYTPAGSNTLMPTTTVSGAFRQNYGDSGSSGGLSSSGGGGNPVWKDGRWQ